MMKTLPTPRLRSGYTLIEALIVFAVFFTLSALLLVSIQAVRERSNRLTCQAQIRTLSLAVHLHHDIKKAMPPYASGRGTEIHGSWFVHLLPYMGYQDIYERMTAGQRYHTPNGTQLVGAGHGEVNGVVFQELMCPSDPSRSNNARPRTNYLANWYAFSDMKNGAYRPAQTFRDLEDGLSNVVLFAEGYAVCEGLARLAFRSYPYHNFGLTMEAKASDDPSYAPHEYIMFQIKPSHCDKQRTQTAHSAMPVALADGTARFVESTMPLDVWKRILKPRDGNPDHEW